MYNVYEPECMVRQNTINTIEQEETDMAMKYYIEELPMDMVIAAEKLIEKKLQQDEVKLAVGCATQCTAYATLDGKNGVKLYVARKHQYNSITKDYDYHVQLLNEDLEVLESVKYRKAVAGDFGYGISEYVRCSDGYCVEPLTHIAMTVIRRTSK